MNRSRDKTQMVLENMQMAVSEPAELRTPESRLSDAAPSTPAGPDYAFR